MTDFAAIDASVRTFGHLPLEAAGRKLLDALGYRSAKTIELDGKPSSFAREIDLDGKLLHPSAHLDKWREVRFLFQLTNDEIPTLGRQSSSMLVERYGKSIVDSFVFLAIDLEGETWKRATLAGITRAVNSLFPMPVIILFRHGQLFSLAASERRQHKRDASRDVQTGRVTIVLNVDTQRPHRGHLTILAKLDWRAMRSRPSNFGDLYEGWQAALSTKTLNETFYRELANWFFWSRKLINFPAGAGDKPEVPLIRLLTRVIFCWFIKERGLVPPEFFRLEDVRTLLKADPGQAADADNYYKAILQNLFFATLNTEMGEGRKWRSRSAGGGQDGHHLIHSVYRYEDLFADPDSALRLFRKVPFLNGGLFECLDRELTQRDLERNPDLTKISDGKRLRVDGFSDHPKNPLHVPNRIFFGEVQDVDLNADYETSGRVYKASGLFTLFDSYVFTVEENTSVEEEVALDPELLGKVFENLLASYNPETSSSARKMSGSFYTPRYVVEFMVREALAHQFNAALRPAKRSGDQELRPRAELLDFGPAPGELAMERPATNISLAVSDEVDPRIKKLLDPTAKIPDFSEAERDALIKAIENLKVLDPACGSGAFPMGMLQALMDALRRLDPDNRKWKAALRAPLAARVARAPQYDITRREAEMDEAEAALLAFDEEFADNDLADYVRKLHLIERCLYGSDIQPIAILIAKLRFFISLAVEQTPDPDKPDDNLGIKPLPNLETKLVAANSLIPLQRPAQVDLFANPRIGDLERLIEDATQRHFAARTMRTKRKYREVIREHREELADILETEHSLPLEDARMAACWDPFDQQASAPFFDPLWMFQLHDGFDIVIGNPPYVRQEKITEQKPALQAHYGGKDKSGLALGSYAGMADLFVYFIERGVKLLRPGGTFAYITSNKWYRAKYGENLRHWFNINARIHTLIDFGDANVFDAIAYPTVLIAERRELAQRGPISRERFRALNWQDLGEKAEIEAFPELVGSAGFDMPQTALEKDGWQIEPTIKRDLLARIRDAGVPLSDYVEGRLYRGILTGLNEAFVIDGATRASLIKADPKCGEIIRPFLRGRDVKRWKVQPQDLWLIMIESSSNRRHPWTDLRDDQAEAVFAKTWPSIHQWFEGHRNALLKRYDKGKYFWELRACDYWEAFGEPKIVIPAIEKTVAYAPDVTGFFSNDKTSIAVSHDWRYLSACLNSPVSWWVAQTTYAGRQGGFFEFKPMYVGQFPIPTAGPDAKAMMEPIAALLHLDRANAALEQLLNGFVYELYFQQDLHSRGLTLFAASKKAGLGGLNGLSSDALADAAEVFTKAHLAPGQTLRVMLSDLQTLDVVRLIEGKV